MQSVPSIYLDPSSESTSVQVVPQSSFQPDSDYSVEQVDPVLDISIAGNNSGASRRQRRCRLVRKLQDFITDAELADNDEGLDTIISLLDKMSLQNKLKLRLKDNRENCGRKKTSLETRQKIWQFWHNHCSASTNTSRPAKLRTTAKPGIQENLPFHDSIVITKNKRGVEFYESWLAYHF